MSIAYSSKFVLDGVMRLGALMLTHNSEGHALQIVMQIQEEGLHLREFEPGVDHPVVFYSFDRIFFPIPLQGSALTAGQSIGALYDLQPDPLALSGPDYTTLYYPASVAKSQKGVPKGRKAIIYHNADGTDTRANIHLEAYLAGEREPFPTCITPLPVNKAHIRASLDPQPAPVPPPPAAIKPPTPARTPSPAVHAPAPIVKLTLKKPSVPAPVAAPSSAAAAATSAAQPPAPAAAAAAVPVESHKRKREEPNIAADSSAEATSAAASSAAASSAAVAPADSSAPPSPNAKRLKKALKKEAKEKARAAALVAVNPQSAEAAAAAAAAAASWHIDLPANPATMPLGTKWTLESLSAVIPALTSLTVRPKTETAPGVKTEPASDAPTAAAATPSATSPDTLDVPHPLLKGLEVEFANWTSLEQQKASGDEEEKKPGSAPALTDSAMPSPFIAYRSALGQAHYYDQLKLITEKQLIAAPYVLDLTLG